jgi:hypothetical protein
MRHVDTAETRITREVTSWPGVEAGIGGRGELGFRLERRELGHLHGSRVLHIGLPKALWRELHAAGRIVDHPVFPGRAGFGARALASEADVEDALALLRLNYDRLVARHGLPEREAA